MSGACQVVVLPARDVTALPAWKPCEAAPQLRRTSQEPTDSRQSVSVIRPEIRKLILEGGLVLTSLDRSVTEIAPVVGTAMLRGVESTERMRFQITPIPET